ncbi:unnamed protein product [Arabidopsis halleri]
MSLQGKTQGELFLRRRFKLFFPFFRIFLYFVWKTIVLFKLVYFRSFGRILFLRQEYSVFLI